MADEKKANDILKERAMGPIVSTDDIVTRGMWLGQVIPESAVDRLPTLQRWASKALTGLLEGHLIIEKGRQPVPAFIEDKGAKLRNPDYLYPKFVVLSKTHWLLRTIIRALIGEVLTPGCTIEPRFRKRCTNCMTEYDSPDIEKCEVCDGTTFDTPNVDQYKLFKQLKGEDRKNPTSLVGEGRTFKEFLFSTLWYGIALDDWYWEIGHTEEMDLDKRKIVKVPRGVRVLDGAVTFPVMDEFGNFASTEFFCPVCYKKIQLTEKYDAKVDLRSQPGKSPDSLRCDRCGGPLIRTAYVQRVGGKVVSRFGKDEVIHASTSRIDPEVFGLSKIIASVKLLYIIDYMDEYNLQIYSHGHANMILGIEGADKHKAEEMGAYIQNQIRSKTQTDARTGEAEYNLEPALIILGLEQGRKITPVDISPKLDTMQSIDYYRLYVEKTCGLFGVSPIFVNISEGEQATSARPRIDVQNHVTRQWMSDIEEPFNNLLLPKLGITDWVLAFGKIESRDELRDREIKQRVAATVAIYEARGHDVEVTEDGMDFTVSPKAVRPAEGAMSRLEAMRTSQTDMDPANAERTSGVGKEPSVSVLEPEDGEE